VNMHMHLLTTSVVYFSMHSYMVQAASRSQSRKSKHSASARLPSGMGATKCAGTTVSNSISSMRCTHARALCRTQGRNVSIPQQGHTLISSAWFDTRYLLRLCLCSPSPVRTTAHAAQGRMTALGPEPGAPCGTP